MRKTLLAVIAGFAALSTAAAGYAIWYFNTNQTVTDTATIQVNAAVDVQGVSISPAAFKVVLNSADDIHWEDGSGNAISSINVSLSGVGFQTSGMKPLQFVWSVDIGDQNYFRIRKTETPAWGAWGGWGSFTASSDTAAAGSFNLPVLCYSSGLPTNIDQYNAMKTALATQSITLRVNGGVETKGTIVERALTDNYSGDCEGCTSMTSAVVKNGYVPQRCFYGCTNLTSVSFEGATGPSLEQEAFSGCTSLASLTLPATAYLGSVAIFWGCTKLTSLTYQGTKAQWSTTTHGTGMPWNSNSSIKTVVCTDGSITL